MPFDVTKLHQSDSMAAQYGMVDKGDGEKQVSTTPVSFFTAFWRDGVPCLSGSAPGERDTRLHTYRKDRLMPSGGGVKRIKTERI